jgi:hypothetical protein
VVSWFRRRERRERVSIFAFDGGQADGGLSLAYPEEDEAVRRFNNYHVTMKLPDGTTVVRSWLDASRALVEQEALPHYEKELGVKLELVEIKCVKQGKDR